ncbi:MAG TPA: hypothetical protein VEV17_00995 [Bryobacteraceae bacterium]|nr:hypothetical protein [Bryobacteraceae bacterium]
MKPELKELMEDLQVAFNESVCESDRIAAVLAEIKSNGYDVVLALEVTIGVTAATAGESEVPAAAEAKPATAPQRSVTPGKFELTDEDQQFLRALKIGVA